MQSASVKRLFALGSALGLVALAAPGCSSSTDPVEVGNAGAGASVAMEEAKVLVCENETGGCDP